MSDVANNGGGIAFLQRKRPAPPAQKQQPRNLVAEEEVSPEVTHFLSRVNKDGRRLKDLECEVQALGQDVIKLETRNAVLANDLKKTDSERREYHAGYCEIKAQLAVLITACTSSNEEMAAFAAAANRRVVEAAQACTSAAKSANEEVVAFASEANRRVMEVAQAALNAVRDKMRNADVDPIESRDSASTTLSDEAIRKVGEAFGADASAREEDPAP